MKKIIFSVILIFSLNFSYSYSSNELYEKIDLLERLEFVWDALEKFWNDSYEELKKLYKKEDMKDLKFAENSTDPVYRKRSFVYDFLSSMRQKINDPLGKRKKK